MDLDHLKQTWNSINKEQSPNYSMDEIDQFRKSRSKDFSKWIRSSIRTDFIFKTIIGLGFLATAFLFKNQNAILLLSIALALLCFLLIVLERPHFRKSIQIDQSPDALSLALEKKLQFLKAFYFKIQFLVGLTNPLLVTLGSFFYYFFKYQEFPKQDVQDLLVFGAILLISFLFTIPTTAGLYGFHLRSLQNSLANLENPDHWETEIVRYHKSKKILVIAFLALVIVGILTLLLILFR